MKRLITSQVPRKMPVHHLMVGTWTPPGAIFTFAFNDETLSLELVKRTDIPKDEPISWMSFDVGLFCTLLSCLPHGEILLMIVILSMQRRTSTALP